MYDRKKHSVKKGKLTFCLSIFCIIILLLSYVGMHMYIFSLEENVRKIRKERLIFKEEIQNLEVKVAELRKVGRIKPFGVPETLF